MATQITRVTMVKIPSEEHQKIALQGYEVFTKNQKKDGVPYILSMQAGLAFGDVAKQGYTLVAKTVFKNKEDMEYYEKECAAHQEYKDFLKKNAPIEGIMSCYFTPDVSYES